MTERHYLGLEEAREFLASIGVELNERQMKRTAEPDAYGKRRLPFFRDPANGKLRVAKDALLEAYDRMDSQARNNVMDAPAP